MGSESESTATSGPLSALAFARAFIKKSECARILSSATGTPTADESPEIRMTGLRSSESSTTHTMPASPIFRVLR